MTGPTAGRAVLATTVSVIALLASAVPATAKSGSTQRAIDVARKLAGDNDRYVAYLRPDGVPVVWDTERDRIRSIRGAKDCRPIDVGGDRILLVCPAAHAPDYGDSGFRARTASVEGGRSIPLVKSRLMRSVSQIGRYWVQFSYSCFPGCDKSPTHKFINWRTGRIKIMWPDDLEYSRNLDKLHLPPGNPPPFVPDLAEDGYPYTSASADYWNSDVVVTDRFRQLRLWYGTNWSMRLGPGNLSMGVRVGNGHVAWSRGRSVHAIDYRTAKRYNRRFKRRGALIAPVADGIVIAARGAKRGKHERYRIKLVRLG